MPAASTIEETLISHLTPGVVPRDLMQAVRRVHPEATKKEIITAAFAAMIYLVESDPDRAREIHDFALRLRSSQ